MVGRCAAAARLRYMSAITCALLCLGCVLAAGDGTPAAHRRDAFHHSEEKRRPQSHILDVPATQIRLHGGMRGCMQAKPTSDHSSTDFGTFPHNRENSRHRHRHRQTHTQAGSHTDTGTHKQTDAHTQAQTQRRTQTDRRTHTDVYTFSQRSSLSLPLLLARHHFLQMGLCSCILATMTALTSGGPCSHSEKTQRLS